MQCSAEYKVYDKDGQLNVTLYCFKEKGHEGPHEHILEWENDEEEEDKV